ncbi:TylF/MycF/NovP-related O-methyltransferase [Desulfospira joergensenii]|uniref:TylF/MycF/NovP-related O-methyltransferase n=1 Tax=Desulfospira joergensenii TaxID=53329 RepID=UPI0003F55EAB|nr:TylF/MycF/NovP-related O-methyltransferase [Desulfospira joergensenii]
MNIDYNVLNFVSKRLGHTLLKRPRKKTPGYGYVIPRAHYSPWLIDNEFQELYEKIKRNTLVDIYRCYELWQLISQCIRLNGNVLEIGVWRGGTSAIFCSRTSKLSPDKKVYCADTFQGVVKAGAKDSSYKGGEHRDTSVGIVKKLLSEDLHCNNYEILEGIFPEDTAHKIKNEVFCFCHIDVDVYESARDIVDWVWSRLVVGGLLVFDDYGFFGCSGITKYVNELRGFDDRYVIHNLNGHAIVMKLNSDSVEEAL